MAEEHLTHGWEPDLDEGDSVLRRYVFGTADRNAFLAEASGGRQERWPDLAVADPASPDLTGAGLRLMGHPPLMVRPAGGTAPPAPPGLHIVEVTDEGTLEDFVRTLVEAYPMPSAGNTVLADPNVLGGPIRLFVGYLDGKPVATSGARLGHGIVDVEWISCRSAWRGRGIGAARTWAATLADPGAPAVLIASDDGQPVYEAMGYLRLMRLTLWHRPAGE